MHECILSFPLGFFFITLPSNDGLSTCTVSMALDTVFTHHEDDFYVYLPINPLSLNRIIMCLSSVYDGDTYYLSKEKLSLE